MNEIVHKTFHATALYFDGHVPYIQHFVKVLEYATVIGEEENLSARALETLQLAAILHDCGIPNSEKKYGNCCGQNQELEGPPVAREILASLGVCGEQIDAVCEMISLHHSFSKIGDNLLLRILVEADMLVNAEQGVPKERLEAFKMNVARTEAGKKLLFEIYGI